MKALNKYVLPLMQNKGLVPNDPNTHWSAIGKNAFNVDALPEAKVEVPKHLDNMLQLVTDHVIDNRDNILDNSSIEHLQEVDMLKAIPKGTHEFRKIEKALKTSLKDLDHNSALIQTPEGIIHSSNVQKVNGQLTSIAETARLEAEKMSGGIMPFMNVMSPSSAMRKKELSLNIPTLVEYNNINPETSELARMTAHDIKNEAESFKVERKVITPETFASNLKQKRYAPGTQARQELMATMPEYADVIRRNYGNKEPDIITSLNDKVIDQMHDVKNSIDSKIDLRREARAQRYKELSNRARQNSKFSFGNYDKRISTLDEANITKTNAMKELGWAQENNGKLVSGAIAMPGESLVTRNKLGEITGRKLDPSKVLLTSKASVGFNKSGHYSGLSLTDVTIDELKSLSRDHVTPKMERGIIKRYLGNKDIEKFHTDERASQNYQKTLLERRKKQYGDTVKPDFTQPKQQYQQPQNSSIREMNEGIIERGRKSAEEVVERSPVSEAIEGIRSTTRDIGSEARTTLREMLNSKAALAAGVGIAFVGALALAHKQHSSDGGTPEQKADGKGAPTVDGNYNNGYNNSKAKNIATKKTARVEENGKGMTVSVRAKNPGVANDRQVQDAVSGAVNSSMDANITIHNTDDRSTINSSFVSDIFSQALGK